MKTISTISFAAGAAVAITLASASVRPSEPVEGTVKGKIVFEGEIPELKPLTISEEQAKGCCAEGEEVDDTDRSLVIDKESMGIKYAVIEISVEGKEAKPAEEPVELDQKKCRFDPHVVVVPVGSKVAFLNSDSVTHNIHTYPLKNDPLNKTVSGGGRLEQTLDKAEAVKVACDFHPWMASYIYVSETPYAAVSAADGSFEISGLPPGEYEVEVWHESLGKADAKVTVKEDGTAEAVEIKMQKEKRGRGRRRR